MRDERLHGEPVDAQLPMCGLRAGGRARRRCGAGPMVCETYFLLPSGHAAALCLLLETRGPSTHAHTTNTQRPAHPRTCVCAELRAAIAAVRLQPRAAIAAIDRGSPGQGHLGKNPPPRWAFYRTGTRPYDVRMSADIHITPLCAP